MTPDQIAHIHRATELAVRRWHQLRILQQQFAVAEQEAVAKLFGLRTFNTDEEFDEAIRTQQERRP